MARDVVLYVEQPGSMEGTRTEEFLREISVRFMVKNLVSFSENLWDDRWGKGKEESGTRDYFRSAHMFAGQLRGGWRCSEDHSFGHPGRPIRGLRARRPYG